MDPRSDRIQTARASGRRLRSCAPKGLKNSLKKLLGGGRVLAQKFEDNPSSSSLCSTVSSTFSEDERVEVARGDDDDRPQITSLFSTMDSSLTDGFAPGPLVPTRTPPVPGVSRKVPTCCYDLRGPDVLSQNKANCSNNIFRQPVVTKETQTEEPRQCPSEVLLRQKCDEMQAQQLHETMEKLAEVKKSLWNML